MNRPYLVIEWNDSETEATGWLCCYNFVSHYCGGGLRVHPTVTKEEVIQLATCMGYKYSACESTVGGGAKGGICYDNTKPDMPEVVKRFLLAMSPYLSHGVALGGDLGISFSKVMELYQELDIAGVPQLVSPDYANDPKIIQGLKDNDTLFDMQYKGFGMYDAITGFGAAAGLDEAWKQMGGKPGASVMIQGFGIVGTGAARCLDEWGYKIVGISDANLMVYCKDGLDVNKLIEATETPGVINKAAFKPEYVVTDNTKWVDLECDIFMPAALDAVINKDNADRLKYKLVVEAANIPVTMEADDILKNKGILVAPDFIINLGATWLCDVAPFGKIKFEAQSIIDDCQTLIRKHIKKIFAMRKEQGITLRNAALELFRPLPSQEPAVEWAGRRSM